MKRLSAAVVLLSGWFCSVTLYSQPQPIVDVEVSMTASALFCPSPYMVTMHKFTANLPGIGPGTKTVETLNQTESMMFSGTISGSSWSGSVSGSGEFRCSCPPIDRGVYCMTVGGASLNSTTVTYGGGDCETYVFTATQTDYEFEIGVSFTKRIVLPDYTAIENSLPGCSNVDANFTITLPNETISASNTYNWQVSEISTGPWYTFKSSAESSISTNAAELYNTSFSSKYGSLRFLKVVDAQCARRVSGVSNSFVFKFPAPSGADVFWVDPKCYGNSDGSVTINSVTGQSSQYLVTLQSYDGVVFGNLYQQSYNISQFPLTIPFGLNAGRYKIIIANTDAGACFWEQEKIVGQPTELVATLTGSSYNGYGVACNGYTNGWINLAVSGGTPGYTYNWSNGATGTASISNLSAATYSVTVTDSKGCTKSPSYVINAPDPLTVSVSTTKTPSCAESADGQLTATPAGGVPGYSYLWSNNQTTAVASNLLKGSYSVNVTDLNGCVAPPAGATLNGPDPIGVTLDATSPTCVNGTNGRVWVSDIRNAPGPVTYLWNTNDNTYEVLSIPRGTYSVTVSSVNGGQTCTGTATRTLNDPGPWTASIIPARPYNGAAIRCNGESNARLDVVVRNDMGNVSDGEFYTWSTGESGSAVKFIENLSEGSYSVSVRYNGICEANASYSLLDPEPVTVTIAGNSNYNGQLISCYNTTDASLKISASGGGTGLSSSFSYSWSTGATGTTISGIGAGEYNVIASDVNGCIGRDTFRIANPSPVEAFIFSASDFSGYGISCAGRNDGRITSGASGGTNVFSYSWSDGKTTALIDNLVAGNYTLTVSDNNGCTASVSHEVTSPAPLTLQVADMKNISCFNGEDGFIVLRAGGGASQYQYSKDSAVWQPSTTFDRLPIGDYELYVRDANSCTNKASQLLSQPTQINIDFSNIEPAYCANPIGRATGVVSGGVGNYRYEWRPDGQAQILSTTDLLADVPAGIYELFISDGNSCPANNAVAITSTDGAKTTYRSTAAKCFDSSDGSAIITITEGEGPFVIKWPDNQNTLEGINLKRGAYNVLVTDVHDCTVIQPVLVDAPDALQLNVMNKTIPSCNAFCDGQITLAATGGVGNYVYEWNNKTVAAQDQLCAGIYPVIIKDGNGCTLTRDVALEQPAAISLTLVKATLPTCKDGCDGSLEITASGGNSGYQYTWATGGNTNLKSNTCPGEYRAMVTDVKGCTGEGIFTLSNTPPLPLNLGGGVTLCVGQTYTLDAGAQWTSVQWKGSNGLSSNTQKIIIKDDGQYWLEAVNDKGCVAKDTFLLQTRTDLLQAEFFLATQAMIGDTVVMVDVSWPLPEGIEWNYPSSMKKLFDNGPIIYGQFNDPGTYEIVLKARLGECRDEMAKTITILRGEEDSEGGRLGYEKFVKEFTLHPNPNDGNFTVKIELLEESDVVLSVWNTVNSKMAGKVGFNGKKSYLKKIDFSPLSPGTYVLRLDHVKGRNHIRFIVH